LLKPDGILQTDPGFFTTDVMSINNKYQLKGYADQVQFLNNRLPEIISAIIKNSSQKPIIIIQGDHGLDLENRSAILNAYYFPDNRGITDLYPSISPVNSFRIIFNEYFGKNYPLLPDISYQSATVLGFEKEEVPESNPTCLTTTK
jgi:hypothetical protein